MSRNWPVSNESSTTPTNHQSASVDLRRRDHGPDMLEISVFKNSRLVRRWHVAGLTATICAKSHS